MAGHASKAMAHLAKCGYASGGMAADVRADKAMVKSAIRQHENHEHGGKHTALKFARGGATKHKKGGTHVNVIVAPQGGQGGVRPVPVPVPAGGGAPAGGAPGMGAPAMARPAVAPPAGVPGGVPMRPPGMKRGGSVKHRADGGATRPQQDASANDRHEAEDKQWDAQKRARGGSAMSEGNKIKPRHKDTPTDNKTDYLEHTEANRGGAIKRMKGGHVSPPMDAGAGGGLGRLEKIKVYGARPRA